MNKKELNILNKRSHIYIDLFGKNIHFTQSKDEYKWLVGQVGAEFDLDKYNGIMWINKDDNRCFIGVFNDDKATLVHECVHCALRIMESVGQNLYYEDEVLPYLTDLIYMKCIEMWKDA